MRNYLIQGFHLSLFQNYGSLTHGTRLKDAVNMEDLICLLATVRTLNAPIYFSNYLYTGSIPWHYWVYESKMTCLFTLICDLLRISDLGVRRLFITIVSFKLILPISFDRIIITLQFLNKCSLCKLYSKSCSTSTHTLFHYRIISFLWHGFTSTDFSAIKSRQKFLS